MDAAGSTFGPAAAIEELERVLGSEVFRNAARSSRLLRFLVEQTLAGRADQLKEYTLGVEVLGRGESFDPRIDSIARVEVSRLRGRLEQYYAAEGRENPLVISLPKGTYVPLFEPHRGMLVKTGPQNRLRWFFLGGAAGGLMVAIILFIFDRRPSVTAGVDRPLVRLEVELRSGSQLGSVVGTDVILSPDGTRLAFVATDSEAVSHLYTRKLNQSNVVQIAGTDGARAPFFSPDGQWVGFFGSRKLKKAPVGGGVPIVLCDADDLLGASWGEDGYIIAVLNSSARLWRIPAAGGSPVAVVDRPSGVDRQVYPQVLQDGKAVLFTAIGPRGPDAGDIEVYSFADRARKTLVRGGSFGRYLPSGHLVYVNQATLYAVPFDLERRQVRGTPVPILPDVNYSPVFGFAQFDFSKTGTAVYRRTIGSGQVTVEWLDSSGHREPILSKPGSYLWPRLSPDASRLALVRNNNGGPEVVVAHLRKRDEVAPIPGEAAIGSLVWNPDGRFLLLGGFNGMNWALADGSMPWKPFLRHPGAQAPWSFTPDGKRLAYYQMNPATHFDVWTVPLQTSATGEPAAGTPEPFVQTDATETYPAFSPDGRWLSYASNRSGSYEVYVRAFPDNGTEVQVSKGGGRSSHWTARGQELFYGTDDQRIMFTSYRVRNGVFEAAPPKLFTDVRLADKGVISNFDISPDGKRVVALLPASGGDPQAQNHVTFLLNFFDEVRRISSKP